VSLTSSRSRFAENGVERCVSLHSHREREREREAGGPMYHPSTIEHFCGYFRPRHPPGSIMARPPRWDTHRGTLDRKFMKRPFLPTPAPNLAISVLLPFLYMRLQRANPWLESKADCSTVVSMQKAASSYIAIRCCCARLSLCDLQTFRTLFAAIACREREGSGWVSLGRAYVES